MRRDKQKEKEKPFKSFDLGNPGVNPGLRFRPNLIKFSRAKIWSGCPRNRPRSEVPANFVIFGRKSPKIWCARPNRERGGLIWQNLTNFVKFEQLADPFSKIVKFGQKLTFGQILVDPFSIFSRFDPKIKSAEKVRPKNSTEIKNRKKNRPKKKNSTEKVNKKVDRKKKKAFTSRGCEPGGVTNLKGYHHALAAIPRPFPASRSVEDRQKSRFRAKSHQKFSRAKIFGASLQTSLRSVT